MGELDARDRHKLRIAIKKLRYASEFFENLFPGRKRKKRLSVFKDRLKALQDRLGALNDIAVQQKLATRIAAGGRAQNRARVPLRPASPPDANRAKLNRCLRLPSKMRASLHMSVRSGLRNEKARVA